MISPMIENMDFCTLGMLIIDEIHFQSPRPPVKDILGGAGTYSALGARLFQTSGNSHLVSWTVHVGNDFPTQLLDQITSWKTSVNLIDTKERATTRGWNHYGDDDFRDFKYLNPKIQVDYTQLTEAQLRSKCFHIISSPSRCVNLVKGILEARQKLKWIGQCGSESKSCEKVMEAPKCPIFVWEPVPPCCVPEEVPTILAALQFVDVISPNHHELAALYRKETPTSSNSGSQSMEVQANNLLNGFDKRAGTAVVVRRGEQGCYVAWNNHDSEAPGHAWYPAYHKPRGEIYQNEQQIWNQKVIDPTGGGNAFLGGFCIGLLGETKLERTNFELGAIYGSIAASFAIEQLGMPSLSQAEDRKDLWNGESVAERIWRFRAILRNTELIGQ